MRFHFNPPSCPKKKLPSARSAQEWLKEKLKEYSIEKKIVEKEISYVPSYTTL